jgi:hypothetical protein
VFLFYFFLFFFQRYRTANRNNETGTIKERQNLGGLGNIQLGGLGSLDCNLARLRIVNALGDTEASVSEIEDPATQSAAADALGQAQGGIQQIAQAIGAGEAPPQDSRGQVEAGLTAAGEALASGDR